MKPPLRCNRCEFRPGTDPEAPGARQQLEEHAAESAHPLCCVCRLSLALPEDQTCETCLTETRSLLSGIVTMYFEDLPAALGQLHGGGYDRGTPPASDGRPLPGGDVLVLLGGGSEGLSEDALTTREGDVSSVSFDLGFWEQTWREARGEPKQLSHRPKVVVRDAAGYLERKTRWAATTHPGFADYADDLRLLHLRMERATGRDQRRIRAEAECFGCGADALERQARPAGQCAHEPPRQELLTVIPFKTETPAQRDARILAWTVEHASCEQGGYENHWTCQRCGEKYDWQRYLLAISGRLQTSDVPGWGLPEQVAFVLGVNPKTVRSWCARNLVATACVVKDPRLRVWWDDARVRAERLHEENRRRAERAQEREAS